MGKLLYYLPRILAILIVVFVSLFILEGFGPDFGWQDSLAHALLALIVLSATIVAWKWPKIGGWVFVVFGVAYFWMILGQWRDGLLLACIPLVIGVLFLAEGFKKQ